MNPIVIVGTGLAGYTLARELRKLDSEHPLVLVTSSDGAFYSKPMLSNALAKGKDAAGLVSSDAAHMAQQLKARVLTRTRVEAIEPGAHRVHLDGETIDYSRLVLAVGALPIRLPTGGNGADQVLAVNDLDDYARFRQRLEGANRVAIIGPGLIGCEFANDLAASGRDVTVIGPDQAPLGRLLPPQAGQALHAGLAKAGVDWHLQTQVRRIDRSDRDLRLSLGSGVSLAADLVLSAVGLQPATDLAASANLAVGRGIQVDRLLLTSAPDVYAIGDCAEVEGLVLPYVMPIMHAARALARTLSGEATALTYPAMPVVVKTPDYPVVVAPPAPQAGGSWREEALADGVRGRFVSADGRLLGFALTGGAVAEKQALTKQLPPVLS
jgi:rubredoxin-NAD+ reductase